VTKVAKAQPKVTKVAKAQPKVTKVAKAQPKVTKVAKAQPKVTTVAKAIPKVTKVAKAQPKVTTVAKAIPKVTKVAKAQPKVTTVAKAIPKVTKVAKAQPKTTTIAKARPKTTTVAKARPKTTTIAKAKPKTTTVAKAKPKTTTVAKARPQVSSTRRPSSLPRTTTVAYLDSPPQATIAARLGSQLGAVPSTADPGSLPAFPVPSFQPEPLKLPEPDLARRVEVTGVIQVGDAIHAIVKAPDETTSRQVQPGEMLSNGQVLVKRIEVNQGLSPVVVLEQYGVEVDKRVGDKPPATTTVGEPTPQPVSANITP
ncbi:MAG: hypothetical protein KME08_11495, partial [Aphanothece sp. CMT-3BRIN-NPC111]|nr:hypothetical protein [Aphanothece sp. CMT-3BRIN-NPC111]